MAEGVDLKGRTNSRFSLIKIPLHPKWEYLFFIPVFARVIACLMPRRKLIILSPPLQAAFPAAEHPGKKNRIERPLRIRSITISKLILPIELHLIHLPLWETKFNINLISLSKWRSGNWKTYSTLEGSHFTPLRRAVRTFPVSYTVPGLLDFRACLPWVHQLVREISRELLSSDYNEPLYKSRKK